MTQVSEPRYDTDPANKAYVDRVNGKTVEVIGVKSRNFGMAPEPPYHVNDTYMDGSDIYICIQDREFGVFDKADWKLAVDYTNDDVANSKNKVFTEKPVPPYNKGDLWTSGPNGELRRCVTSRASGSYVESDWENATSYDSTNTVIENGLVTSGTIQVVNGGTVAAGMTGNGSGDDAVRFWAGSTSGNKNSAPFRVTQRGYLYAENANIAGTITAKEGKIGAWTLNAYKLYATSDNGKVTAIQVPGYEYEPGKHTQAVFAAGGTNHNDYSDCPFLVNKNGYLKATSGNIGGWELSRVALSGSGAQAVALYSDGRMSMGNTYGWINTGEGGNWFRGNSRDYPLYLLDDMYDASVPEAAGCSIRLHTIYGKLYGSANTTFGSEAYAGGSNLSKSDVEFAANNGSSRYYSSVNTWIYGGQHVIIDGGASGTSGQVILKSNGGGINIGVAHASFSGISDASNVWIGGTNTTVKIKGATYGGSGRNMKTNITPITEEDKTSLLDAYKNRELYSYNFKEEYGDATNAHVGFVLEELEDSYLGSLLGITQSTTDENIKTYDPQSLGQLNFTVISLLLNKIDKLEERIKLLEGGNQYE